MRAGRIKHPMTIQRPVDTTGADGVVTQAWRTVAEVWASKLPVGTRESIFALDTLSTSEQVEIDIREAAYLDLSPACRFVHGAKTYEIVQVILDDVRDRSWRCLCQRRVL
jgi:head-tail adaptor